MYNVVGAGSDRPRKHYSIVILSKAKDLKILMYYH